ncbi:MAG: acyltransferase [bacterium]
MASSAVDDDTVITPTLPAVSEKRIARIPSLDGLRAISIAAVLMGHLAGTQGFPPVLTSVLRNGYVDFAALGVTVFFVISGFLITGLLLAEEHKTGGVNLARFYIRRTLRIVPAYAALLIVVAVLDSRGIISVPRADFVHALTYTMNYESGRTWYLGHLWSLAVEEQFYLLWPAAFAFTNLKWSTRIAFAVFCLVPFIRLGEATLWPGRDATIFTTFETAADALAGGCLLALSRDALFARPRYRRLVESAWAIPALLVVGLAVSARFRPAIVVGHSIVVFAVAAGVDRCVRHPDGAFGTLLNARPVVFVGTLSYSLYLWQQLFLNRGSDAPLASFPANIVCATTAALLCHFLIEKQALKLRSRVEGKTPPRAMTAESVS